MTKLIEHVGIAVKNLESAVQFYEKLLGIKCYKIEQVPDQKVRVAFFTVGETKLELLESSDPDGPVARFIEKRGEGLHHIAFAVNDIKTLVKRAGNNGIRLIDSVPREGADNLDIAFLHPGSTLGVLIELCERKIDK